jgi:hypothetical protein
VLLTGPESDPILAVWSAGIGRSAAFTSDLKDRWGAAWTRWPGAARLIAQVARDVTRKGEDTRVRLEADASGGELHVRASVVGDDGRAQSFRRLVVKVVGPEGFGREMALEASGAGAYSATLPLSRPGTYIAVARDELSGQAVGTTGAVLSAGEELRPTGSDLALLGRIAEFTGGKRRDTLAGIFADRASKRFAYKDTTPPLLVVAAFALLLAVAARRLAMPEAMAAWVARVTSRAHAAGPDPAPAEAERAATAFALLQARDRARSEREPPRPPGPPPGQDQPASPQAAPPGARVGPPVPAHLRRPATPRPLPAAAAPRSPGAAAPPPPAAAPAPPAARPLTAAEILLAKRRGKRG